MNQVKHIAVVLALLVISSCWADDFLPDGRYVFTCSKFYSGLCDISSSNSSFRMVPIEDRQISYIKFKRSWTGKLVIESSNLGYSEIGVLLLGKAKRHANGSFEGRMTVIASVIPIIPCEISWAKWSLRSATKEEIHAGLLHGLKEASISLYNQRYRNKCRQRQGEPGLSEEELIHWALMQGSREGYSDKDVTKLREWFDQGILTIVSNQFALTKTNERTGPESTGAPPVVETPETHP